MSVTGIGNKTHVKYSFSCSDDAKLLGESNDSKWKVTEFRTVKAYCGNLSHSADSFLAIPKQFLFAQLRFTIILQIPSGMEHGK
jgi:hypothetical protein